MQTFVASLYISDAVCIFLEVFQVYNTNIWWQYSCVIHEKQLWVYHFGTLENNSIVIRRLFTVLHKYLKRNKAAMKHTIYLWEFLLNISATSPIYSKIQRHTFLEKLRFPICWVLKMAELCFRCTAEIASFCFCTDDKTRVPLGEKNGYINASYIRMNVGEEEHFYITTQGPLPSTMDDFWQMVWESESDVIAMMTKEVELGQVKCHRYWPESPYNSKDLSNFCLRLHNYQILEYFIIRKIEITNKQVSYLILS